MTTIISGDSPSVTFSDGTTQTTSAIVSGKVPYTNLPAGSVLQVVNATYSTEVSTSGATFIDTGLTATITPKFATSKILAIVNQVGIAKAAGNGGVFIQVLRGATFLSNISINDAYTADASVNRIGGAGMTYLDSPATTSATTYKTQFYAYNSVAASVQKDNSTATITLMEIAG